MPPFTQPPDDHLSETILRQFLGGNLSSETVLQAEEHLASCSQCRSRLALLVREGNAADTSLISLTQALSRSGLASPAPELAPKEQHYPDFETIAAYVDGTLAREQTREFEVLMRRLPRLDVEVAELRALKDALQSNPSSGRASVTANATSDTVPPMIVQQQGSSSPSAKMAWPWWRWPARSLGLAVPLALLLLFFAIKPWQRALSPIPSPHRGSSQSTPPPVASTQTPPLDGGSGTERGGGTMQSRLLALSNPRNVALLDLVKIQPYKIKGSTYGDNRWHPSQSPDARKPLALSQRLEFQVGDGVQFSFANQSSQTLYLALLWLTQDGHIVTFKQNGANASPVIKLTPKGTSGSQTFTRSRGFVPPIGVEHIKFFVSTRPLNAAYLNFRDTQKNMPPATETESPLDAVIKKTRWPRTDVKSTTPMDYKTWATTTSPIYIREK